MRKGMFLSSVLILLLVVTSLSAEKKPKIGFVMYGMGGTFQVRMMYAGNQAATDYNVDLIWKSAESSLEKELGLIENFIQQGVDVILIDPIDRVGVIPGIDAAQKAGIPLITAGNFTDHPWNINTLYNDRKDCGRLVDIAKVMLKNQSQINAVRLIGSKGNFVSDERNAGYVEGCERNKIETLSEQPSEWDPVRGMKLMEDWLVTNPNINFVMSASDTPTMGALQALSAAGKKPIFVTYDGDEEMSEFINNGTVLADVLTGGERVGYWNIAVAARIARGEKIPRITYLPSYIVATAATIKACKAAGLNYNFVTVEDARKVRVGYRDEFAKNKKW